MPAVATTGTRRLLTALLVASCAVAPATGAAAALPDPHVGTPILAPAPPAVGGQPAESATYRWRSCRRYGTLVGADAPRSLWSLNEAGGTATDGAGTSPGTWSGAHTAVGPGPLAGDPGTASTFDGIATAVAVPAPPDVFTGTAAHTVELWVRPRTLDTRYRYLWSKETTTATGRQGTGLWVRDTGIGFERWRDGTSASITVAKPLTTGVWHHVVATYDGAVMRLYVDGIQIGAKATTLPLSTDGTLQLGAGAGGRSGFLAGELDEVALYDRAVSRSHVAAHDAAAATDPCTTVTGATDAAYTPTPADIGNTIRVTVTGHRTTAPAGDAVTTADTARPTDQAGQLVRPEILTPAADATVSGDIQLTGRIAGLPFDRVEFVVDGVVRYAKDETPLQYTWYTDAEPNGRHTLAIRTYGPRSTTPVTTTETVTVSNRTTYPTPLPFGRESMYAEFNEGDRAVANNLLDNVWPARGFPLVNLGWPLTWTEDPYDDAFWRFYQYGLRPLSSLLYMWQTTGELRYRDRLIAILRSYAAYDAVRPVNRLTFDNNHAAAYRAMSVVNLYFKLSRAGALPDDLRAGLEASIARMGAFLADPAHFESDYNHGFNEGAALLLIADNFPDMPGAAQWRTTGIARLQAMLTNTVDPDGVEVENSPFYHVYVLGLVRQIAEWARVYEPALAPAYTAAAQKMLRYAAYVTQPSGYLPMLGATATTFMPAQDPTVYGPMADADPEFAFAYTRGARGTPPPDGVVLFPSSGLFLLRSPMGSAANLSRQTFVTFDAGPYRTEHSDLDALGVTVYSDGSTVLPESGLFTYTQQPERAYFHGTRAHNTVVVDGRDQAQGAAVAGPSGNDGASSWATGTSDLYAGVGHRRSVAVLRQGMVLVVDRLTGATAHDDTQTWHLQPGAVADISAGDVYVNDASGARTLTIRQASPAGMGVRAVTGQTSPVLQGWFSSAYGSKVPSTALEFTRHAATAAFTTLLTTGPYASRTGTVVSTPVAGGTRVDVCVGGTAGYTVTVPDAADGRLAITSGACPAALAPTVAADPARAALPAPTPLTLSAADQTAFAPLAATPGRIPVLLFHSICPTDTCTAYNMTPAEFARTMLMLRAAGYHTISMADFSAFMRGAPVTLPAKPVLITFDDARLDGWRGADATLAALGERATVFTATGWIESGDARFLHWDELARMQASGRWDVQEHAGQGHVTIQTGVDAAGAAVMSPYYAWRRYDPARYPSGDHLESFAAWQTRVHDDIDQADALLRARIPGYRPMAFSLPFGDYGQFHNNDARIPTDLATHLTTRFGLRLVQPTALPRFNAPGAEAWRYTVRSTTTADQVYAWLAGRAAIGG